MKTCNFSAQTNWRFLTYECRIEELSADTAKEIKFVKSLNVTDLSFPAESSHSYKVISNLSVFKTFQSFKASVRACILNSICSDWSNVTNTALSSNQLDRLIVYIKSADGFSKVNLLGEEIVDEKGKICQKVFLKHSLKLLIGNDVDTSLFNM